MKWIADIDYYFFRNNVPRIDKLSQGVISSPGSSAYCCQCAWRTVMGVENMTQAQAGGKEAYRQEGEASLKQLKWVCSGR